MKAIKRTVVIDMDGTLADLSHRLHFVRQEHKKFDDFHAAAAGDMPNAWCVELMKAMRNHGYLVYIVSARPKRLKNVTTIWLSDHEIPYDKLILLRENDDHTKDQELKRDWVRGYGAHKILFVVDDRQCVVDTWRAEGVTCLQCNQWDEFHKPVEKRVCPECLTDCGGGIVCGAPAERGGMSHIEFGE
jgi:FMN phosphatase YigB (HAD superfamily)